MAKLKRTDQGIALDTDESQFEDNIHLRIKLDPSGGLVVTSAGLAVTGGGGGSVTSVNPGTGITITGPATAPIVNNAGVLDVSPGTGIGVGGSAQHPTITNTGVLDVTPGTGVSIGGTAQHPTFTNTGVTTLAGDDGITVSAATGSVTVNQIRANWAPTLFRYFLLDYDGGNDTNVGYVDAAPGADLTSLIAGKARKTVDGLLKILPRVGDGRKAVILIKARSGADKTYYKADGITADDLILITTGYQVFLVRSSTDLTNTTLDKQTLGAQIAVPGPNGDGSWTVSAYTGRNTGSQQQITVAAGTLPTDDSIKGRRCRIVGGRHTNECFGSFVPVDATNFRCGGTNGLLSGNTIDVGDSFWFEKPGVVFNTINILCQDAPNNPLTSVAFVEVVGLRGNNGIHLRGANNLTVEFCESGGDSGVRMTRNFSVSQLWGDEAANLFFAGIAWRHENGQCVFNGIPSIGLNSYWNLSTTRASFADVSRGTLAAPMYFKTTPVFTGLGGHSGSPLVNNSTMRVIGGGNSQPRVTFDGGVGLSLAAGIDFAGIEFSNMGASNLFNITGNGDTYTFSDVVLGAGTMTGIGLLFTGRNNTVITETQQGFGGTFNTASPSGGEVKLADGTFTTWAALRQGSEFEDINGNRIWSAVTGHAQQYPKASWDTSLVRYFLLDNDNGNDANVGYVDAAAGADLTALISGKARKTVDGLRRILPRNGDTRRAVVLVKARSGSDKKYYKIDGTTPDDFRISVTGYLYLMIRASSDLTNSATERVMYPGVRVVDGPNDGGTFSVGSFTSRALTVAAGTLPVDYTLHGRRIRYTTGAQAGKCNAVHRVNSSSTFVNMENGVFGTPAAVVSAGDEFVIEKPAVEFADIYIDHAGPTPNTVVAGTNLINIGVAGIRANGNFNVKTNSRGAVHFCEAGIGFEASAAQTWTQTTTAPLEDNTLPRCGASLRAEGGVNYNSGIRFLSVTDSAIVGTSVTSFADINGIFFGSACFMRVGAQILRCSPHGGAAASGATSYSRFGSFGSSTQERLWIDSATFSCIDLFDSCLDVYGVDVQNQTVGIVTVRGSGLRVSVNDLVSTNGGNTNYGLNLQQARNCFVQVGSITTPTVAPTAGQIIAADNAVYTWAAAAAGDLLDSGGNRVFGVSTLYRRTVAGTHLMNAQVAGGVSSGGSLDLQSTTDATKGLISFDTVSGFYWSSGRHLFGVGSTSGTEKVTIAGIGPLGDCLVDFQAGSSTAFQGLQIKTVGATVGGFVGYQESTNHFRFHCVPPGGEVRFMVNGTSWLKVKENEVDVLVDTTVFGQGGAGARLKATDSLGTCYIDLLNRGGANGPIFGTIGFELVDMGFKMGSGAQRNLRLEGRGGIFSGSDPEFHVGGTNVDDPSLIIWDGGVGIGLARKLAFRDGDAAAVGVADTGAIRYSKTNQRFEASTNGGTYQDIKVGPQLTVRFAEMFSDNSSDVSQFAGALEQGWHFYATKSGISCTGVKAYWDTAGDTLVASIWNSSGTLLYQSTVTSVVGINTVLFPGSVSLSRNKRYTISFTCGSKHLYGGAGQVLSAFVYGIQGEFDASSVEKAYMAGDIAFSLPVYNGSPGAFPSAATWSAGLGLTGIEPILV